MSTRTTWDTALLCYLAELVTSQPDSAVIPLLAQSREFHRGFLAWYRTWPLLRRVPPPNYRSFARSYQRITAP